ncbi:MAG: outer membrane lipoprotein-sorting protein [Bacteroidales bacterium]|nr:outer membrane lipoprotein-sorting protein [Bacteroidales bacterium]
MKKVLISFMVILLTVQCFAQDAKQIVAKADEKFRGKSNFTEMTLEVIRPKWTRSYTMKSWSLGNEYSLVVITAPASDKGQAFLKRSKDLWSWNPAINRMVKMPPSMMSQGWMGSDISNDDLMRQSSLVNDYSHTIKATETIGGKTCSKIELIPVEDADVIWGKINMWISKDDYLILKAEYYDDEMDLVHTEKASEIKTFDGREIPSKLEIIPASDESQRTVMYFKSMDFDISVTEGFFSQQNMKTVR